VVEEKWYLDLEGNFVNESGNRLKYNQNAIQRLKSTHLEDYIPGVGIILRHRRTKPKEMRDSFLIYHVITVATSIAYAIAQSPLIEIVENAIY